MISIPKPCSEDWNNMTPKERGRLCDKCCKVVVDFTQKTTEQIVDFFTANAGTRVCGRFRAEQVAIPVSKKLPRRSVFLAALYFAFGAFLFAGCNSGSNKQVMGKVASDNQAAQLISSSPKTLIGDTILPGDTALAKATVKKPKKQHHPKVCKQPVMGDVMYVPDTVPSK